MSVTRAGAGGRGIRGPREQRRGLLVEKPGGAHQPRLEPLDGERLERLIEVDAGGGHRHRHEADERERQLDGDAATERQQQPSRHGRHHTRGPAPRPRASDRVRPRT
jgi:hypothetical protein